MLDKLRAKPHGGEINLHHGSFEEFKLVERFQLIYVVFSTFFCLQTQEAQLRCFRCVSEHLASGGAFLLEGIRTGHGPLQRLPIAAGRGIIRGQRAYQRLTPGPGNPAGYRAAHSLLRKARLYPLRIRYAWPAELDLMARLAGLRLDQRWGSWEQAPFTREQAAHFRVCSRVEMVSESGR